MKLDISGGGCFDPEVCEDDTRLTQARIISTQATMSVEVEEDDEDAPKPRKGKRQAKRARKVDYSIFE